jgi:hypothetical protein
MSSNKFIVNRMYYIWSKYIQYYWRRNLQTDYLELPIRGSCSNKPLKLYDFSSQCSNMAFLYRAQQCLFNPLKKVLTVCTMFYLTLINTALCPQSIFFIRFSPCTAHVSLNNINQLVLVIKKQRVFCAVGIKILNITLIKFHLQRVTPRGR